MKTALGFLVSLTFFSPTIVAGETPNDHDFLPAEMVGKWAGSQAECDDIAWIVIQPDRIIGYEMDGRLLIASSQAYETTPNGQDAITVNAMFATTAEGEVYMAKIRLSRAGDFLYMSNAEAVIEADHWNYPNIRCNE